MCGIAGFLSGAHMGDSGRRIADRMARAISHRGPDSLGSWSDDQRAYLVHTRLAIVDLTAEGHQPMVSAAGRFVISFNGEIYNHTDLRRKLEASGVYFRGRSDTEVLLAHIEAHGLMATLTAISGMFAFALVDRRLERLYLVRDRLGEKPLYYGYAGKSLVFGSELKALWQFPDYPFELDPAAVAMYLKYNYVPAPFSILRETFKVSPAHVAEFDLATGLLVSDPYPFWSLNEVGSQPRDYSLSESEAADLVEEKLKKVIGRQIMADVPVGCFLSGGIDSSLVSALAQGQLSSPLKTFTIGFDIEDYNEAPSARAIAAHLGTQHEEWIVRPEDVLSVIPSMPDIYDEPFADSSQLPTTLLSRLTRRAVTVCLSGDGGDELFGGYNRYLWAQNIWSAARWVPNPAARWLGNAITMVPPGALTRMNFMNVPTFAHKVAKVASLLEARSRPELYDRLLSCWESPSEAMRGARAASIVSPALGGLDFIEYMMLEDSKNYLTDDIMVKVDRATMSVALESRAPLLDHELYELAWRLPVSMKVRGSAGKGLLRRILARHVPPALWQRPKSGFAVPLDHWFRADLNGWLRDLLGEHRLKQQGLFDADRIQKILHEHERGQRNWQYKLWNIAMFQAWIERWKDPARRLVA